MEFPEMNFEKLDPAIIAVLPVGSEVISVVRHGKTNILDRERAAEFAEGEYESQKALVAYIPDNVVHPIAWGRFEEDESKAFFLTTFRDLRIYTPPLGQFLTILKGLHQASTSPNGKFGFHVTTFYGASPMLNDWCDTWEEFFTREFRSNLQYAQDNRGPDDELAEVAEKFIATVIPRLLRPLQTGGRKIKPTLCHGDLWDGNIQQDRDSKQPVIFDACCFYGHNEMELQCMRDPRYAIGLDFLALYEKEVGASEPKEDFDDRNALYSMRNDLLTAGMWPQWASLLQRVRNEMLRLLEKHPSPEYVEPDGVDRDTEARKYGDLETDGHQEANKNAFGLNKSIDVYNESPAAQKGAEGDARSNADVMVDGEKTIQNTKEELLN